MDNPYQADTIKVTTNDPSNVDFDWSTVDLSLAACVTRGLMYVQRTYPTALAEVDIDKIELPDVTRCPAAQIHRVAFYLTPEHMNHDNDWLQAHGFMADPLSADPDGAYAELTRLWQAAFRLWASQS